ncbi:cysteine desulfurase NifS [Natranaerobius thermophilus]|uniref:Cysteine desulfurase IscS n=1 Tax=Natranaerobius thermophilus (strain ATCC BAA-1301 / DSM 18059 / JW/NM-WN-LF) TaxID=457570 RepID=B2A4X8_NATTJ|nr:cysteine desulfurase NifS [Natranaerobius thermophilus]ACB83900.1 cysteine desulfurase NifS [Natranaerobius thermophilus JW/NM-WN-LF]
MNKIYLDHGATTPMREEVFETMKPYLQDNFGNPSSIHSFGREVRKAVDEAREQVANAINAQPEEIIFTSGGTESDNLAIQGVIEKIGDKGNHIITTQIEHHAVLDTCEAMEEKGYKVTYLPVDKYGLVNPKDLQEAINEDTVLITIMHGNNEVGTIQPIKELAEIAKDNDVYFHTDAVQTVGNIPIDVQDLGIDMLTLSAHKFYGPKGIGALYIKKGTKLQRVVHGGAQERKIRPGTENVPGIVGLGKAIELATEELDTKGKHIQKLRDKLIEGLSKVEDSRLNGHPERRLPNNVNMSFEYIEGESLLLNLDMKGIAASSGSACTSGSLDPSHVLMAMGLSHQTAHGSLRLTLGRDNTEEEIDYVIEAVPEIVNRLRDMSSIWKGKEANYSN